MSTHHLKSLLLAVLALALSVPSVVRADWDPGDGHKMHYPQLPDPLGWDVRVSNARTPNEWIVADDWQCSETGPVGDVHFWYSWQEDRLDRITNVHLSIHSNIAVGPEGWSIPGEELWSRDFAEGSFTTRLYGSGEQGWYDPSFGEFPRPDHHDFYQLNISGIDDPFIQQEGEIYWLDISVSLWGESEIGKLGWKTSLDHFMDDAVYWDVLNQKWVELRDPATGESLDMAFVITVPEPSTCVLFGCGLLGLLALARARKRV